MVRFEALLFQVMKHTGMASGFLQIILSHHTYSTLHAGSGHGHPSAWPSPTIHRLKLLRQDRHRHCEGLRSVFTCTHNLVDKGLNFQTNFRLTPQAFDSLYGACDQTPGFSYCFLSNLTGRE